MPPTSLTKPESPASSPSSKPQLLFLGLGLLSFALLWAAPVALLVWVFGLFFGSVGIAEALERTRGLAPTTYGGAFWLAVVITLTMAAIEVRAMLRGTERRSWLFRFITRPSTAYFALLAPTVLLVRLDTRGTDVPDILTTTLLLCCLGYVWFILPLGMAAVAWRLSWWMWRKGSGSSFAAGVLGMLGISFATCTPLVCAVDDEDERWPPAERVGEAFGRGFERARGQDAIDGSRTLMGALAEINDSEPAASLPSGASGHYTTHECMEALVEPERDGSSRLTKVIRKLRTDYPHPEIEDVVYWKMIDICVDEPRRNDSDLFGLLLGASRNGLTDIYRHGQVESKWAPAFAGYRARCLIDSGNELEESYEDRQHRLATALEALSTLDPDDRELLADHYLRQLSYAEMARRRGKNAGAIAKATNRAVHALREWLASRCH